MAKVIRRPAGQAPDNPGRVVSPSTSAFSGIEINTSSNLTGPYRRTSQPFRVMFLVTLSHGISIESRLISNSRVGCPPASFAPPDLRWIAICNLVEKDDEFNQVCVRLLPEGFLAPAEKAVQKRGNVVCQRVSVEVIIYGVVAVLGAKADFD